jgi:hypothetical protein
MFTIINTLIEYYINHKWKLLVTKCVLGAELHAYQLTQLFAPNILEPLAIHDNIMLLSYKKHCISLV